MRTWRPRRFPTLGVLLLSFGANVLTALTGSAASDIRTLRTTATTGRQGAYYIPPASASSPLPILVFLHGTGGKGSTTVLRLRTLADRERFIAIAPDSVSVAGTWLVDPRPQGVTEDHRHVLNCVREVLALPDVRADRLRVLLAGFSVGSGAAAYIASREDMFTAFAVLHGHVPTDILGPRRVRGWLSTGARDRLRTVASVKSLGDQLRGPEHFPEIETRVFPTDHSLGDEELAALVAWWLRGGLGRS